MNQQLRLTYANDEFPCITAPDVQMGLDVWNTINKHHSKWATFEACQYPSGRVVHVNWGTIHTNGEKETAIETISFQLDKDGVVKATHRVHT